MAQVKWRKHKPKIKDSLWVWGPFCFLKQRRHAAPFNKTRRGAERRAERRLKSKQRELCFCEQPNCPNERGDLCDMGAQRQCLV